jgi:hypothetical protein
MAHKKARLAVGFIENISLMSIPKTAIGAISIH